jgi:cyclic beta-1,2-glucan synthetase
MDHGDWNDGMNRVGQEGRGESVWLGWFLAVSADLMADMEKRLGRDLAAGKWATIAAELRERVEQSGWDGDWYRRAYYDDGHPLGAAGETECQIDSISQSWAVFAGARPDRIAVALESAGRKLIDRDGGVVRLLWPPFDDGPRDPGYIKAYPPGVRENGGHYAHAAAWLGMALAKTGDGRTAHSIFSMINPIERSAQRYLVEPYVVAGDIHAAEPHVGRGGWTWYTGAAAWTWRLAVEGILGLELRDGLVHVEPCLPPDWDGYRAILRRRQGSIALRVERSGSAAGVAEVEVDGEQWSGGIPFPIDGSERQVLVKVGKAGTRERKRPTSPRPRARRRAPDG